MTKKDDAKTVTVTVLRRFEDYAERCDREVGEEFEATVERAEEIDAKLPGYIRILRDEAPAEQLPELSELSVAQLKALAKERGITIPAGTKKAGIVDILTKE